MFLKSIEMVSVNENVFSRNRTHELWINSKVGLSIVLGGLEKQIAISLERIDQHSSSAEMNLSVLVKLWLVKVWF